MVSTPREHQTRDVGWGWPLVAAFSRLPLILLVNALVIVLFRAAGTPIGFETGPFWFTLSVTVTNVVSLAFLRWRARVERLSLRDMVGFDRQRWLRDLGLGVLWSLLLFAVLMVGFFAAALAVQALAGVTLAQLLGGDVDFSFDVPGWVTVAMTFVSAVAYPFLNAPVEELQYRGYAQPRLVAASGQRWLGIGIAALGFGLQHMAFAWTLASAPVYAVAFFAWGLGAGLLYHRHGRLAPLIVAHFISNLSFGVVPLLFVLGGAPW